MDNLQQQNLAPDLQGGDKERANRETSNPTPSDIALPTRPPTRPHLLAIPKQLHQLVLRIQIYEPTGAILPQITTVLPMRPVSPYHGTVTITHIAFMTVVCVLTEPLR